MDVVSVTSPVGFWRAFLKLKVGGAILAVFSIIENGQKGRRWEELVAETTPTKRDVSDNPPVTQLATPLFMQHFKV